MRFFWDLETHKRNAAILRAERRRVTALIKSKDGSLLGLAGEGKAARLGQTEWAKRRLVIKVIQIADHARLFNERRGILRSLVGDIFTARATGSPRLRQSKTGKLNISLSPFSLVAPLFNERLSPRLACRRFTENQPPKIILIIVIANR